VTVNRASVILMVHQ